VQTFGFRIRKITGLTGVEKADARRLLSGGSGGGPGPCFTQSNAACPGLYRGRQWCNGTADGLPHQWGDDIRKGGAGPVEPGLHGSEVDAGNLGDFLVRLAFEFAEYKHLAVMYRQTTH
jgi:hypothetical protein